MRAGGGCVWPAEPCRIQLSARGGRYRALESGSEDSCGARRVSGTRFVFVMGTDFRRFVTRGVRVTSGDGEGAVGRDTRTTACLRARLVGHLDVWAATVKERLVVATAQPLA